MKKSLKNVTPQSIEAHSKLQFKSVFFIVLCIAAMVTFAKLALWQIDRYHFKLQQYDLLSSQENIPELDLNLIDAKTVLSEFTRVKFQGKLQERVVKLYWPEFDNSRNATQPYIVLIVPLVRPDGLCIPILLKKIAVNSINEDVKYKKYINFDADIKSQGIIKNIKNRNDEAYVNRDLYAVDEVNSAASDSCNTYSTFGFYMVADDVRVYDSKKSVNDGIYKHIYYAFTWAILLLILLFYAVYIIVLKYKSNY